MCLHVRKCVCNGRDRYRNRLCSVTQYFWHDDKALQTLRVNNIQQTGEACFQSPASPLCFDKIVLATTSHRLRLQTVTYCPRNCRGECVRRINSFLIIHLAQCIYSAASQAGSRDEGWQEGQLGWRGEMEEDGEWDIWRKEERLSWWKRSTHLLSFPVPVLIRSSLLSTLVTLLLHLQLHPVGPCARTETMTALTLCDMTQECKSIWYFMFSEFIRGIRATCWHVRATCTCKQSAK